MNKKRLEEIKNNPNTDIKEVIEILSEFFISQSKHSADIKKSIDNLEIMLSEVIQNTNKMHSPVFQLIDEDYE